MGRSVVMMAVPGTAEVITARIRPLAVLAKAMTAFAAGVITTLREPRTVQLWMGPVVGRSLDDQLACPGGDAG
jgi:hypothetical protein